MNAVADLVGNNTAVFNAKLIVKNVYVQAAIVAIALTSISYLIAIFAGWLGEGVNWLELFAVITSYACTYLGVKQKRFNYVVAVVTVTSYCILFWQWGLISSMLVQIYLLPTVIYGWFRWGKDTVTRPVRHVQPRWIVVYLGVTAILYVGAVWLTTLLGATSTFWDSAILALTILAQFLLDNKRVETWIIWAILNVIAIGVYFDTGLYLAAIQYVFFLANAFYGYYEWNKSMTKNMAREAAADA